MRIGFACAWRRPPELTWSYIPIGLYSALKEITDVVDLSAQGSMVGDKALAGANNLLHRRPVVNWRVSRLAFARRRALVSWRSILRRPDALLQVSFSATHRLPFFLYQDLSISLVLDSLARLPARVVGYDVVNMRNLLWQAQRERKIYRQAALVFAMSQWFADDLVARDLLRREDVVVVHAGCSSVAPARPAGPPVQGRQGRLLFVGSNFLRKGGDLVLAAFRLLRARVGADVTLTIVGPESCPEMDRPPPGVTFLGHRTRAQVGELFASHDLLVMPSRFEPFGIVFVEALAHGMPCIGRNACAMPEIIRPGINGELVTGDDPEELCAIVLKVLADDALYATCRRAATGVIEHFSWKRVAADMLAAMQARLCRP